VRRGCMVAASNARQLARQGSRLSPSVDELFRYSPPVSSDEDLAPPGIFADGEVDELIADLRGFRRADPQLTRAPTVSDPGMC